MDAGITFTELLEYTEAETAGWKTWFIAHPEALDIPCDIAKAGTVRKLLLHIFATEMYFACSVLDRPKPDWETLPVQTVAELFQIGEEAHSKFRKFISQASTTDWGTVLELGFGGLSASKRKMVAQALLHGVHHRGQLATFLRQQGLEGMWVHDLILTGVMDK
jgi:uncharacterized damage-inducible protein DinB